MGDIYRSFKEDFQRLCQAHAQDALIIIDTEFASSTLTYQAAFAYCRRYITFLHQHGLQAGDTVVGLLPNSLEAILCFFACILSGINYAPLPCTVSRREFDSWFSLTAPKLILKKSGIADYAPPASTFDCKCSGDLSWLPEEETEPTDSGCSKVYLMTSGTTGAPKAMVIDANKLWSSAAAFAEHYHLSDSMLRFWNYLPMSYLGGLYNLALIPLFCGGSFVISEPFSGKTMLNFWNYVKKHQITALWFVPSIIRGLLKLSKLTALKHVLWVKEQIKIAFLGTAPIRFEQKQAFEDTFGLRLFENFALSETTFLTAEAQQDIRYREQSSVGSVLPYVEMKFCPSEDGMQTIWVKTPFLFEGYLSADGTTMLPLDEHGFFNTNDLGRLNEDDVLVLSGRSRDIIKKSGLFVSLAEIEASVGDLPSVEEAAAVPIEHDFYGEAYILCVRCKNPAEIQQELEKIHMWLLENFVPYKLPEKIIPYGEFPRTASGKIQKKQLAEQIKEMKKV